MYIYIFIYNLILYKLLIDYIFAPSGFTHLVLNLLFGSTYQFICIHNICIFYMYTIIYLFYVFIPMFISIKPFLLILIIILHTNNTNFMLINLLTKLSIFFSRFEPTVFNTFCC